jgi:hypothetical protein
MVGHGEHGHRAVMSESQGPLPVRAEKMMRTAFAVVISLLIVVCAAAADPIGRYWSYNPKSTGQSTVVVRQTGGTYHIDWGDNGDTGAGFGILNKDLLAVTHTEKDWSGFLLLGEDGEGWVGPYANLDGAIAGMERWDIANQNATPPKPPAMNAKIVGRYVMSGSNPDGSTYSGQVVVKRAGNLLQVVSVVGDDQRIGAGITYRDGFAVIFQDKESKLLKLFKVAGGGLTGFWASDGSAQMGAESWARFTQ